jgi:predicted nucleotidyltransferase
MLSTTSPVLALQERLGASWPQINAARVRAQAKRVELREKLQGFDSDDTSIVVFGSLARDEFTDGSDIDWTLLIDGSADPKHLDTAREVGRIVGGAAANPWVRKELSAVWRSATNSYIELVAKTTPIAIPLDGFCCCSSQM